jgi:hypothetical protein
VRGNDEDGNAEDDKSRAAIEKEESSACVIVVYTTMKWEQARALFGKDVAGVLCRTDEARM